MKSNIVVEVLFDIAEQVIPARRFYFEIAETDVQKDATRARAILRKQVHLSRRLPCPDRAGARIEVRDIIEAGLRAAAWEAGEQVNKNVPSEAVIGKA